MLMKKLLTVTILLIFSGCASQNTPSPSQNKALNSVTNSTAQKERKGWMQEQLDSWLEEDEGKSSKELEKSDTQKSTINEPETNKNETVTQPVPKKPQNTNEVQTDLKKEKTPAQKSQTVSKEQKDSEQEEGSFTLQHLVDKLKSSNEDKKGSSHPSHVEELNKMPAIGN